MKDDVRYFVLDFVSSVFYRKEQARDRKDFHSKGSDLMSPQTKNNKTKLIDIKIEKKKKRAAS
jgi:hypothetical protein